MYGSTGFARPRIPQMNSHVMVAWVLARGGRLRGWRLRLFASSSRCWPRWLTRMAMRVRCPRCWIVLCDARRGCQSCPVEGRSSSGGLAEGVRVSVDPVLGGLVGLCWPLRLRSVGREQDLFENSCRNTTPLVWLPLNGINYNEHSIDVCMYV